MLLGRDVSWSKRTVLCWNERQSTITCASCINMVPEELVVSEVTLACKYTRHSICLPDMLGLLSLSSRCELSFELWQTTAAATGAEHCIAPRTQVRGQELVVEDGGGGRWVTSCLRGSRGSLSLMRKRHMEATRNSNSFTRGVSPPSGPTCIPQTTRRHALALRLTLQRDRSTIRYIQLRFFNLS